MQVESLPTIEGWLDKQGGVRKSWKRRFFVLDGKRLKYFKQQKDAPSKPIDSILLEVCRSFFFVKSPLTVLAFLVLSIDWVFLANWAAYVEDYLHPG
jgi:hypothetical protein